MFDSHLRPLIDPPLNRLGKSFARNGITADRLTLLGFIIGLAAAIAITQAAFIAALVLIAINRVIDGLDGAVARATTKTDRGGFLDITLDFAFYGLIPLAFAVENPAANGLAAALLLASFYVNGAAFLAFAIMAEKRGIESEAQGVKSLYYLAGLAEGAETILVFCAFCLFPGWFPEIAITFAAITALSAIARIVLGAKALS